MKHTLIKLSAAGAAAVCLAACSPMVTGGDIDYKSAHAGNPLEIPPDLTKISTNSRFALPGGSISASRFAAAQEKGRATDEVASTALGDVRLVRQDGLRWLVVERPPQQIWPLIKTFWEDTGFVLSSEDPRVGVMETDWAENRAKLPQDIIRSTLGKAFDSLYSTGEMDRFRTRVERNAQGHTTIAITHRGMQEVLTGSDKNSTTWQARPSDPELENEMLRRLMVTLGLPQDKAQAALPKNQPAATAASTAQHAPQSAGAVRDGVLHLSAQSPETAWRLVGTTINRAGFTLESDDAARGFYQVRYVPQQAQSVQKPGLFNRLLGKKADVPATLYRIQLSPAKAGGTTVQVLDQHGQASVAASERDRILRIMAQHLHVLP